MHLLYGIGAYVGVGVIFAAVFVSHGVTRVLVPPRPVSRGARLMLAPGAAVLWPLILYLWLAGGERR
jgi:hypothetical protein